MPSPRPMGRWRLTAPGMRWRIGLAFALLALLLFGAVAAMSALEARRQVASDAAARLGQLAARVASDLDVGMYERMREVRLLAEGSAMLTADLSGDAWRGALDRLQDSHPQYTWVGVTDAQGRVLAASDGLLVGADASGRPWFLGAARGPFVGDVHGAVLLASLVQPSGANRCGWWTSRRRCSATADTSACSRRT